jgi:hypothetical protein
MNKVRRPKFTQSNERFGSGINRLVEDLLGDSATGLVFVKAGQSHFDSYSGTAGATMAREAPWKLEVGEEYG